MAQALRKAETVSRSPERQLLAEKIDRVTALRERLGRMRAGLEENQPYKALAAKDRAEEALQRARETEAERVSARILGDVVPEGQSLEEAERAHDAAAKEYDRVSHVSKTLKQGEADALRTLDLAEFGLRNAIGAVVQSEPAVGALLKCYAAALREADRLRRTIRTVSSHFPRELNNWDLRREFEDISADPAWAGWIAALEQDADAPAPILD